MVLHDRADGDGDGLRDPDAGTSEIWRVEVVEPSGDFVRRGIGEKEANLTLDTLPITVNMQPSCD